jgi:hypothetical protein
LKTNWLGILPGLKLEDRVIQRLSTALKQNIMPIKKDAEGVAPNVFTLIVAPESSPMWKEQRTLDTLKAIITTAVRDSGLKFTGNPTITISTDDKVFER